MHVKKRQLLKNINGCPAWAPPQIIESVQNDVPNNSPNFTSNEWKSRHGPTPILHDKGKRGKQALRNINHNKSKEYFQKITNLKLFALDQNWEVRLTSKIWQKESINTTKEVYNDEIGRLFSECVEEHRSKDNNSYVYQLITHLSIYHSLVSEDDFKILNEGYRKNKFKRKISEALFIK